MACFVGIDIGTSSVRAAAVDERGRTLAFGQCEYDIIKPKIDQAEQNMEQLWESTVQSIQLMLSQGKVSKDDICGIGYSGQMHGLVMVDGDGKSIRNAIIWADQRTEREISGIYEKVPKEEFDTVYLNRLSTGFALPSLMWVKEHEPENFQKIDKIFCPKDYIRFKMCGRIGTDASDASSTGMWDMKKRTWAYGILEKLGVPASILPESHEACETAGRVTEECAQACGLKPGTVITYGGGDSLMMELGNGMIRDGIMASTIGTACHLTCALERPAHDMLFRTNTWCHAGSGLWSIMGAHLSGGAALKWLRDNILEMGSFDEMNVCASKVPAGSEGLLFLPYLNGERTPHNDANAKAVYLGLSLKHTKEHIIRSTMEGIVYSMKESYEILKSIGVTGSRMIASGGGAKSPLLCQIQADMYNCPVLTNREKEQASLGAAITASVGCGYFRNYEEACGNMVCFSDDVTEPDAEHVKIYNEGFLRFKEIYKANKGIF